MTLDLPPRFAFADFKRSSPLDIRSVVELVLSRHGDRMTVKRLVAARDNLHKIFDATFKIANKVGFAGMTLRDLCRETGLSMGGLYGYFRSKDELADIIEDVVRFLAGEIPSWFEHVDDPRLQLDHTLRAHLFLSELLHPWFFFVFMESRLLSASQRAVARSAELHIQTAMATFITAAGVSEPTRAGLLAAHLLASIQDWHLKRWKYKQLMVTVDAFAESVCEMASSALDA